jgi:hypothetical protein
MSCRSGACKNYNDLCAMANALVQVEAQFDLMPDEPPLPSEEDRRLASGFEAIRAWLRYTRRLERDVTETGEVLVVRVLQRLSHAHPSYQIAIAGGAGHVAPSTSGFRC